VNLDARLHRLLDEAASACAAAGAVGERAEVDALRSRLGGPLRIAIVGRVKAGKSTLLNALVGQRLAPTDAGECTRIVTWYADGPHYGVRATLRAGDEVDLAFARDDEALHVDLGGRAPADVASLRVTCPSAALRRATLVDTPGLGSATGASTATDDLLLSGPADADAVLYLMRHLHRLDADFLEAFTDTEVAHASPVHAVAVLSRADEVGGGRLDGLASAARIAARYARDELVRSRCAAVVPVSGLLAATGATLTEHEHALVRALAAEGDETLDVLLASADRFVAPAFGTVAPEERTALLDRLGLFGVRWAVAAVRRGDAPTATALARLLVAVSGVDELRAVVDEQVLLRARTLQARAVLRGVRVVGHRLAAVDAAAGARVAAAAEEVEAGAHELAELRLAHLVGTGLVPLDDGEAAEVARVTTPGSLAGRLGLDPDAAGPALVAAALDGVARWRERAERPSLAPGAAEAAEVLTRTYEGLYAEATSTTR
jgi:hypothetical protein